MARAVRRTRRGRKMARARVRTALGYGALWTVLAIVVIVVIMAPQMRFPQPEYQRGDIATADVMAPVDLTVEDPVSTERRRTAVDQSVPNLYDYVPAAHEYGRQVVQSLFAWGRAARPGRPEAWAELTEDERFDLEQQAMAAVGQPLPAQLAGALWGEESGFSVATELAAAGSIISLSQQRLVGTIVRTRIGASTAITLRDVITQEERRLPNSDNVLEIGDARVLAQTTLAERLELSDTAEAALGEFVAGLVVPNLRFNSNASTQRRRESLDAVQPVFYQLKRGQVLLRQGDEVTEQKLLELDAIREQYRSDRSLLATVGMALLVGLAVFSLWRYVLHYQKRIRYQRVKHLYLLALVALVGMVALTRGSLFLGEAVADAATRDPFTSVESYRYAVPFASGAVLLMLLVNVQVAWAFSAVFAVVLGAMTQDFGMVVYSLLGSFAGLYGMSRYKERTALTRVAVLVGGVNAVTVVSLGLLAQPIESLSVLGFQVVCAIAGGFLVSIVATIALPPLEHLFQSLTDIKLLELSNMNLPLLKDLAVSAPGTYHHSIVVGTLAEKAAEAIGVNPLFARVSAYYHDIGKLRQPQYFVENQKDGHNPHDDLSPNMSALILVSHVKDGVAYAREHGLPQPLIDAIPEHHGTRLIRFFYEKAKQATDKDGREVDESEFRYPGPKPRSKETAILMLADGIEAISRTLSDTSPARLRAMIKRAIQEIVDDDQLAECALTLQDLSKIADAFLGVLAGMHHQRIEYPEATDSSSSGVRVSLSDEDSGSQLPDQTYH